MAAVNDFMTGDIFLSIKKVEKKNTKKGNVFVYILVSTYLCK